MGELLVAQFHHLDRSMLANTVVIIVFQEMGDGFRVKSIRTEELKNVVSQEEVDNVSEFKSRAPGVYCMSMYYIESASTGRRSNMGIQISSFGEESVFTALIEYAKKAKGRQDEIIEELNEAE